MNKKKHSLKYNLQLIANILSFQSSNEDLKNQLKNEAIDWDTIVIIASKHLMLPALYCRLYQKSLLTYLPEDLVSYLKELTHLNRQRNQKLYQEILEISTVFYKNHINYSFIKGSAMLAGNYYSDIGERMIGDIDILVASEHLDKAFDLLVKEGYSNFVEFNYEVKNYRHRPRQISEDRIGAVELHDQLLKHGYNHLINKKRFLENTKNNNGISIPKINQLVWNIILAQQINDRISYFGTINFKGIYDVLVLKLSSQPELMKKLSKQNDALKFLGISSIFFPTIKPLNIKYSVYVYQTIFLFTLKYRQLGWINFKVKNLLMNIWERIELFLFNKSYRQHILNIKRVK